MISPTALNDGLLLLFWVINILQDFTPLVVVLQPSHRNERMNFECSSPRVRKGIPVYYELLLQCSASIIFPNSASTIQVLITRTKGSLGVIGKVVAI